MQNDSTIRDLRELEQLVEAHYSREVLAKNGKLWLKEIKRGEMWGTWRSGETSWDPAYTCILLGARDYIFDLIEKTNELPCVVLHTRFFASGGGPATENITVTRENLSSLLPRLPNSEFLLRCIIKYGKFRAWLICLPRESRQYLKKKYRKLTNFLYVPNIDVMLKAIKLYYGKKTWTLIVLKGGHYSKPSEIQSSFYREIQYEHGFKINDTELILDETCNRLWFQYKKRDGKYFSTNDLKWIELWRALRDWQYESYDKNWIRDIMKISVKE